MNTIAITSDVKREIELSIRKYQSLIEKELTISDDLRYHNKIELWSMKIVEFQKALISGVI
jgi:hypothetical protein